MNAVEEMAEVQTRRVTANLPHQLLLDAQSVSGKGITETLILGLEMLRRRRAYDTAQSLKGKLRLDLDLKASRERHH